MKVPHRIILIAILLTTVVSIGCGGGSSIKLASNPSGPFSNANLKGNYAFALTGTNSFGFFSITGSLQADGSGNITSGVEDVNSGGGVLTNVPVAGNYSVQADGRGTATLASSVATVTLDFVIVSSQRVLIIRFNSNATASGSMDLQDPSAFSTSALQGAFVFNLSGIDSNSNDLDEVGVFSTDGVSTITGGIEDVNNSGSVSSNSSLNGSYSVGSNGRGNLVLNTLIGPLNFAFYVVDANHIKLVETDTVPVLAGDAFRQSAATLTGTFVFTLGGRKGSNPLVAGGLFAADGNGNITSGTEDINTGPVAQNSNPTGNYSIAASGRGTLNLVNPSGTAQFVIYPSIGGVQMLEVDSSVISSGIAYSQQGGGFSNSSLQGNFGLVLTGVTGNAEFDEIAQFSADGSGGLTGSLDVNNSGSLARGLAATGSYTMSSNGRGMLALQSSTGKTNLVIYAISNARLLFIEVDTSTPAVGSLEHQ